jgi:nicotinamidase-related amidase
MSSGAIRDPLTDHLITPQNAALILIDYQPAQFATVRSIDPPLLLKNIVSTVKTAKTFGLPIVHSTINVASGRGSRRSLSSPSCSRTPPDRPNQHQRMGGRRLRRGCACHRASQARHLRALDRDLHNVRGA